MAAAPDDKPAVDWRHPQPVELSDLLWHASEAFYEQGFHGTPVRDIASRVGVTVPALYYHHENKEAILVAVLEAMTTGLLARGEAAVADGNGDPVREISNLIESLCLHLTARPKLAALDPEYRHLSPNAARPYADQRLANEMLMRSVVARGVAHGAFHVDDSAEATRAILSMVVAVPRWFNPAGPLTPAEMAYRYVDLSLAMLSVSPHERAQVVAARQS